MGCGASCDLSEEQSKFLIREISCYFAGRIPDDSVRFQVLCTLAHFVLSGSSLFMAENITDGEENGAPHYDSDLIAKYLDGVNPLTLEEATMIIREVIAYISTDENTATELLKSLLKSIRIPRIVKKSTIFLSPSVDKKFYKEITKTAFRTTWSKKWRCKESLFDFNDPETLAELERQKSQGPGDFRRLIRNKDSGQAVLVNMSWCTDDEKWPKTLKSVCKPFQTAPQKPKKWKPSLANSVAENDVASIQYTLHLVPELINLPLTDKNENIAHLVVLNNRINLVPILHELGADFQHVSSEKLTPIERTQDEEMLEVLTNIGCGIDGRDESGLTLLDHAGINYEPEKIKSLLEINADFTKPDPTGLYWMQRVIRNRHYGKIGFFAFQKLVRTAVRENKEAPYNKNSIYRELISQPVNECALENAKDLHNAVEVRNIPRIQMLLAFGALIDQPRKDGRTNLMVCAERGDIDLAKMLLANLSNPLIVNAQGENLFRVAVMNKHWEFAKMAQSLGVDIDMAAHDEDTVLHWAYKNKREDAVKFCLEAGCNPNLLNADERTVQFMAFVQKDDVIAELIQDKYNGDITVLDKNKNSLAHIAVMNGDLERLKYLLARGIPREITNGNGENLFMTAVLCRQYGICNHMLKLGSHIDTPDSNGASPFMRCVSMRNLDPSMFSYLIHQGCDINVKTSKGVYPLYMLIKRELYPEAEELLKRPDVRISDPESAGEPIIAAIEVGSESWFKRLLSLGADASNQVFPVVRAYMESDFYNLDVLKTIRNCNMVVGGPLPRAMNLEKYDTMHYIWNSATVRGKVSLSKTKDDNGRIPLSIAICTGLDDMIRELVDSTYDCATADFNGNTPLLFAAKKGMKDLALEIYRIAGPKNASKVNTSNYTALTYAAENDWREFCDKMFIDGVTVTGRSDSNGIISHYNDLFRRQRAAMESAKSNMAKIQRLMTEWDNFIRLAGDSIKGTNRSLDRNKKGGAGHGVISGLGKDLHRQQTYLRNAQTTRTTLAAMLTKYKERCDRIKNASRSQILNEIEMLVELGRAESDLLDMEDPPKEC